MSVKESAWTGARAIWRGAPISAQKARLVADAVRGLKIEGALDYLRFSQVKAAAFVMKVLHSAVANAEHNDGIDADDLKIGAICVDEGRVLKRMHARAKGRGNRILKRSCHIKITVVSIDHKGEV